MNPPKSVKASLRTPDEVRVFLRQEGPFLYALEGSTDSKDAFLRPDEWLFGDDLIVLMKTLLQWDKRRVSLEYRTASAAEKEGCGEDFTGSYYVKNLPDDFDGILHLDGGNPAVYEIYDLHEQGASRDEVETAWLMLFADGASDFGYPLFSARRGLTMEESLEDYLQDWEKDLKSP